MSLNQGNQIHEIKKKRGRPAREPSVIPAAAPAEAADEEAPAKTTQARRKHEIEGDTATVLAGDFFHYLNFGIDLLREHFPQDPKLWLIDRYYPYGPDGAIWIDIPQLGESLEFCEQKAKILHKKKIRYFYLIPEETRQDSITRFHDVMDHLAR